MQRQGTLQEGRVMSPWTLIASFVCVFCLDYLQWGMSVQYLDRLLLMYFLFNLCFSFLAFTHIPHWLSNYHLHSLPPFITTCFLLAPCRYPWGEEAFKVARKENRLIFLSVGYSTCHWCHVMERESFQNQDIARIMNSNFVNVKVDREERPDVDKVYMTFVTVRLCMYVCVCVCVCVCMIYSLGDILIQCLFVLFLILSRQSPVTSPCISSVKVVWNRNVIVCMFYKFWCSGSNPHAVFCIDYCFVVLCIFLFSGKFAEFSCCVKVSIVTCSAKNFIFISLISNICLGDEVFLVQWISAGFQLC